MASWHVAINGTGILARASFVSRGLVHFRALRSHLKLIVVLIGVHVNWAELRCLPLSRTLFLRRWYQVVVP